MKFCILGLLLIASTFSQKTLATPTHGESDFYIEKMDVEIFIYEGIQYFYVGGFLRNETVVIGEYDVTQIGEQERDLDMYFLGKDKFHKTTARCLEKTNDQCQMLEMKWYNLLETKPLLTCQFETRVLRSLYWLTGRHTCDQPVPVAINNDNKE